VQKQKKNIGAGSVSSEGKFIHSSGMIMAENPVVEHVAHRRRLVKSVSYSCTHRDSSPTINRCRENLKSHPDLQIS
jgi:hypothetical protein